MAGVGSGRRRGGALAFVEYRRNSARQRGERFLNVVGRFIRWRRYSPSSILRLASIQKSGDHQAGYRMRSYLWLASR